MTLSSGTRLGPYEILAPLGAGLPGLPPRHGAAGCLFPIASMAILENLASVGLDLDSEHFLRIGRLSGRPRTITDLLQSFLCSTKGLL